MCKVDFDFSDLAFGPVNHHLTICEKTEPLRAPLLQKTADTLLTHFRALGHKFQHSIETDGVEACKILMGCNAVVHNDHTGEVSAVYRKRIAQIGDKRSSQQVKDIVVDTAKYIEQVYKKHGLD